MAAELCQLRNIGKLWRLALWWCAAACSGQVHCGAAKRAVAVHGMDLLPAAAGRFQTLLLSCDARVV